MAINLTEDQIVDILKRCSVQVRPMNSEFETRALTEFDFKLVALCLIIADREHEQNKSNNNCTIKK